MQKCNIICANNAICVSNMQEILKNKEFIFYIKLIFRDSK